MQFFSKENVNSSRYKKETGVRKTLRKLFKGRGENVATKIPLEKCWNFSKAVERMLQPRYCWRDAQLLPCSQTMGGKSSAQWHLVSHSASSCVHLTVVQQTTRPLDSRNLSLHFHIMDFGRQTGKLRDKTFVYRAPCLLKWAAGVGRTLWFSGHGGCWTLWMMFW